MIRRKTIFSNLSIEINMLVFSYIVAMLLDGKIICYATNLSSCFGITKRLCMLNNKIKHTHFFEIINNYNSCWYSLITSSIIFTTSSTLGSPFKKGEIILSYAKELLISPSLSKKFFIGVIDLKKEMSCSFR